MTHFNALTAGEAERLALLAEEAGELVQTIGKILRHGYESYNPDDTDKGSNRLQLESEIADVVYCMELMEINDDIDGDSINFEVKWACEKKPQYLHHQQKFPKASDEKEPR